MSTTAIVTRIRLHGGIRSVHVTPFTDGTRTSRGRWKVIGWQNVVLCRDGTRFALSLEDEEALKRAADA